MKEVKNGAAVPNWAPHTLDERSNGIWVHLRQAGRFQCCLRRLQKMATPSCGGGGKDVCVWGEGEAWSVLLSLWEHETGDPCPCPHPVPLRPPLESRNQCLRRELQLKALWQGNSAAACVIQIKRLIWIHSRARPRTRSGHWRSRPSRCHLASPSWKDL